MEGEILSTIVIYYTEIVQTMRLIYFAPQQK